MNYADKRVIWRCSNCEEEDGKTQCMYAKYKPTKKRGEMEELTGTEKIYNDKKGGRTTGRVVDIPNNVTQFIENELKGRIVTTHPDGLCVRRAIGKYGIYTPDKL